DSLRCRERGVLTTSIRDGRSIVRWTTRADSSAASEEGHCETEFEAEAVARAAATLEPQYFVHDDAKQADAVEGLAEALLPTPLLLVSGGGHVGQALVEQARLVGFDIVVVEDRPQFIDTCRFPPGVETRSGKLAAALAEFPVTRDTYIAI